MSKLRLLGRIVNPKGFVVYDEDSCKVQMIDLKNLKSIMSKKKFVNAELVNNEIIGTECDLNRLCAYDLSCNPLENCITVLGKTKHYGSVFYSVIDEHFNVRDISEELLFQLKNQGCKVSNAKVGVRGNTIVVSGIKSKIEELEQKSPENAIIGELEQKSPENAIIGDIECVKPLSKLEFEDSVLYGYDEIISIMNSVVNHKTYKMISYPSIWPSYISTVILNHYKIKGHNQSLGNFVKKMNSTEFKAILDEVCEEYDANESEREDIKKNLKRALKNIDTIDDSSEINLNKSSYLGIYCVENRKEYINLLNEIGKKNKIFHRINIVDRVSSADILRIDKGYIEIFFGKSIRFEDLTECWPINTLKTFEINGKITGVNSTDEKAESMVAETIIADTIMKNQSIETVKINHKVYRNVKL